MTLFGVGNDHHQSGVIPSTPKREYEEAGDAGRRGCGCATPHMTQLMSTTAPSQPPRASKQVLGLQHVIHTLFAARHPKSPTTQRYKNYVSPHAHQLAFSSSSKIKNKTKTSHIRTFITPQTIITTPLPPKQTSKSINMGFFYSKHIGGRRGGATLRADRHGARRPVFNFRCCGLNCFRWTLVRPNHALQPSYFEHKPNYPIARIR